MDYNDLVEKYAKVHPKLFDQNIIDKYDKKFLLLTPENYDNPKEINSIEDIEKNNFPYYYNNGSQTFVTNEYDIDLKNYYVTKLIQIEFVLFYNSWPQLHDYSTGGPIYKLKEPNSAPTVEYEPIYFTVAISTTAGPSPYTPANMTGFTAYALKVPPASYTVNEFCTFFNAQFLVNPTVASYGLVMSYDIGTGRITIKTTNINVKFFVGLLDINLTTSPTSFTDPQWYDPITNLPYSVQPELNNLNRVGGYFTGYAGIPLPTFSLTTIQSLYYIPYTSTNPAIAPDAFNFDMEEFLLLSIKPFNSTMDIANSSQYQNFMIPNSGGRGEINHFNCQSNFKYSLVFQNKIVLNKISIKWSFYNGQSCLFYNQAPLILISYIPYETTDSRIPFYLE